MFVSLTVMDAKPQEDGTQKEIQMLVDTGSILCIVENKDRPDTCIIRFRNDDMPAGLVKGTYKELCELILKKK